jgi:hypothetical protein
MLKRRPYLHAVVLALYAALAVALTWPLVQHLSTHVPGSSTWALDEYTFLWNSWWFRYAITHLHQNPLGSTYTFYPLGISLVLYTYNLFNAVVALPLQSLLTLPAISNLTFLLATVLSGYGTFLLVRYLLDSSRRQQETGGSPSAMDGSVAAAFLAGLLYAFGSYRMVYASIGHYDMWSTQWIPFYALYLVRTIQEPRMRNAVLAGLFLVLAMLAEMIFGVFLALLTLILLAFVLGRQVRGKAPVGAGLVPAAGLVKRLAVLGLVAGVLYAPLLVPILREMRADYELAGWGDAQKLSVDLMGFVTPTALHPLGGDWVATLRQVSEGTARFSDVNTVFLGWTTLALALVGAVAYRRKLAAWITSALVFALFCLGPLLQINGRSVFNLDGLETTIPLPFILLHYLPVVKANRVPNRFSVVLMLALTVLVGFGAHWLLRKVAGGTLVLRRARATTQGRPYGLVACSLLLAGLLIFEHWSVPLPLTDARVPAVYERLAADPEDYAILQLPLGWRNSFGTLGAEDTQAQYYQSVHHKRLLSGNISRNPPFKFDYFGRVPILDSLITLETYGHVDAQRRATDRATAGEFVSFYDIRYVVVAPGIAGRLPYVDTRDAAVAYVEEVLPVTKVYDQDGWLLYEVDRPALAPTLTIDFGSGTPLEAMALGEGWASAEPIQTLSAHWAEAQDARLLLPVSEGAGYRLAVRAMPLYYPGAEPQRVTLSINGRDMEPVLMSSAWRAYTWEIDASLLRQGVNDLRFRFSRLEAPAKVVPGDGLIGQTGVVAPVAIEVNSGGPAGFAYITVGDPASGKVQDGSLHAPGYNMAEIDPADGRLLERASFDLTETGSEQAAADMIAWIGAIPQGSIVAAALQGCQTPYMITEVAEALLTIGASGTVGRKTDCSHAIIGVKGARTGLAMDATSLGNAWLRAAPDRRTLAIAVDSVTWERMEP